MWARLVSGSACWLEYRGEAAKPIKVFQAIL
jgi:hypothetical protein